MESTETIMKISTLAKELRIHNPGMTWDEAARQAERAITGKTGAFMGESASEELTVETKRSIEQELTVLTNKVNTFINEVKSMRASYEEIKEQLKAIAEEFAFVKNRTRTAGVSSGASGAREETVQEEAQKKEKQITFEKARPLNFEEKDVAVDKIFYFGKK